MGIKGIYGEIGPGKRVSLTKLAMDNYVESGRPLRIAIDIAIWQFQIQAGRGGSDPATRILYYRLLRLLSSAIQPLFVFDGPNKPPVKRNKRTGTNGGSVSNLLTKQLLKYFGFPYHYAPGEAEAECALLQINGVVDAVLSEDVDTLMFGSTLCLRNWSSEGPRGNKAPTHVSAYYSEETKNGKSGLDREGMILVALMSGGDYLTGGIPGCGIKLACEAARAGFGKSLCAISRSDCAAYKYWRDSLAHEIMTNESKFFSKRRQALLIPEDFPNREVLGYYTHPLVSNTDKILKLKHEIEWDGKFDVPGLRSFVDEAFEWKYRSGAIKFIRGLAPALLVYTLRLREDNRDSDYDDRILTAMNETTIVRAVCGKRVHHSTDGIPELCLVYHPLDIVHIDLQDEEEPMCESSRDGLAPRNKEDEIEQYISNGDDEPDIPSRKTTATYDPTLPIKAWVPRVIASIGIPLKVEDYEESLRDPKKFLAAKAEGKRALAKKSSKKEEVKQIRSKKNHTGEDVRMPGRPKPSEKIISAPFISLSKHKSNTVEQPDSICGTNKIPKKSSTLNQKSQIGLDKALSKPITKERAPAKNKINTKSYVNNKPWNPIQQGQLPFNKTSKAFINHGQKAEDETRSLSSKMPSQSVQLQKKSLSNLPSLLNVCLSPRSSPSGEMGKIHPCADICMSRGKRRTSVNSVEITTPTNLKNCAASRASLNHNALHDCENDQNQLRSRDSDCVVIDAKSKIERPLSYPAPRTSRQGYGKNTVIPATPPNSKQRGSFHDDHEKLMPHFHSRRPEVINLTSSPASTRTPRFRSPAQPVEGSRPSDGRLGHKDSLSPDLPRLGAAAISAHRPHKSRAPSRKVIVLRESLPGAWKVISEKAGDTPAKVAGAGAGIGGRREYINSRQQASPLPSRNRWRLSQIDLLDLSGEV
ncbi:Single-stranded DNA endonuclease [Blumeria graminis f. sp. tritici 96224]|uniref:Bgt-4875 n=2 Tax=Blumeria graminis f. sp. tritici TaxID=62690 RepID=A0A381L4A3_BLUGR|nr:Single-stranded DNA endonuclease [Blumeria graminis f. sp. tritici 96224]